MNRSEVKELAQSMVIQHGPGTCLEFLTEITFRAVDANHPQFDEIKTEIETQAERTYKFLGWTPVGGFHQIRE
jgi:hypothetical protein